MEIGETLKLIRQEKGMSQIQMAEFLDVCVASISNWETGICTPNRTCLQILKDKLDIEHLPASQQKNNFYHLKTRSKQYLMKNESKDMVNHPEHYQGLDGLEADEVMQNFIPKYKNSYVGAKICNVLKYILRAPVKRKQLEDLKKAQKELQFAIDKLEKMNEVQ